MDSKFPAYTTVTGVKIGSTYERKQTFSVGRDMELLQSALLAPTVIRPSLIARIVAFVRNRMGRTL